MTSSSSPTSQQRFESLLAVLSTCMNGDECSAATAAVPRDLIHIITSYAHCDTSMIVATGAMDQPLIAITVPWSSSAPSSSSSKKTNDIGSDITSSGSMGAAMAQWIHHHGTRDDMRMAITEWNTGGVGTIGDAIYFCSGDTPYMARYQIHTGEWSHSSSSDNHDGDDDDGKSSGSQRGGALAVYQDRHSCGVSAVVNDRFYLASGADCTSVECYDPYVNRWSYAPSLAYCHYAGAAVTLNGRMISCGSTDLPSSGGGNYCSQCEAYDPRCDTKWQQLREMDCSRNSFSLVAITDYICLLVGGERHYDYDDRDDDDSSSNAIVEYDSRMDKWFPSSRYPALPPLLDPTGTIQLIDHTLVFIPSYYYVADTTTATSDHSNNTNDEDITTDTTATSSPSAPSSLLSFGYYLSLHPATHLPLTGTWHSIEPPAGITTNTLPFTSTRI